MSETTIAELSGSQTKFLKEQSRTSLIFGFFVFLFYILNLSYLTGKINPLTIFCGIFIYRGLSRRMAAGFFLKDCSGNNSRLYFKSLWNFTWKMFIALFIIPVVIGFAIVPDKDIFAAGFGLLFGQYIIGYILCLDRPLWLIKSFRKKAYSSF